MEEKEKVRGVVKEALPDGHFRVELTSGQEILAYLAGRMRIYRIKVLPGDKVLVELSPYDQKRGRIIRRL